MATGPRSSANGMPVDLFIIQTKDQHVKCAVSELLTATVAVTYIGPAYNYVGAPFRRMADVILGFKGQGALVGLTVCFFLQLHGH